MFRIFFLSFFFLFKIFKINCLQKTREVIIQRCLDFGIDLKCQNDVALIIDGNTLDFALSCDIRMDFLDLCSSCKVVICCRVSPMQKAEVIFILNLFNLYLVFLNKNNNVVKFFRWLI